MFESKYIFETKSTRTIRYIKNVMLGLFIIFTCYSILCAVLIIVSEHENKLAQGALFKKHPDCIVIFTGDIGRIDFGITKAAEYKSTKIFITGVYAKNTVETLLQNLPAAEKINTDLIEIDYLAKNTVENVISTLRYLRLNKNMKDILVISHDYHIMRIKLLLKTLGIRDQEHQYFYSSVKTDYTKFRNIKILYKEIFKLIKAYGVLLLWDHDTSYSESDSAN